MVFQVMTRAEKDESTKKYVKFENISMCCGMYIVLCIVIGNLAENTTMTLFPLGITTKTK